MYTKSHQLMLQNIYATPLFYSSPKHPNVTFISCKTTSLFETDIPSRVRGKPTFLTLLTGIYVCTAGRKKKKNDMSVSVSRSHFTAVFRFFPHVHLRGLYYILTRILPGQHMDRCYCIRACLSSTDDVLDYVCTAIKVDRLTRTENKKGSFEFGFH